MRRLLYYIPVLLLCGSATAQSGSFSPGVPSYTVKHMPHVNNKVVNGKHKFTIVLFNGDKIERDVQIEMSNSVHRLQWKDGDSVIELIPRDTKEIYRTDEETGRRIKGVPMDSCWAFLISSKTVRTYSVSAEYFSPLIKYIQKDENSPILPLTLENLEPLIQDHEKALALARKGKLVKALRLYNEER
ncbi:MAG: hypothetical protein ACTHLE_25150 [Agriterribacter sp.]